MTNSTLSRRAVLALAAATAATPVPAAEPAARYRVTQLSISPPRFAVEADLPAAGDRLDMGESYTS